MNSKMKNHYLDKLKLFPVKKLIVLCLGNLIMFGTITCAKNDLQPLENYIEFDSEKIEITEVNINKNSKTCETSLKLIAENTKKRIRISGHFSNCFTVPKDCNEFSNLNISIREVSILNFENTKNPESLNYSILMPIKIQYCSEQINSIESIYLPNQIKEPIKFKFTIRK